MQTLTCDLSVMFQFLTCLIPYEEPECIILSFVCLVQDHVGTGTKSTPFIGNLTEQML